MNISHIHQKIQEQKKQLLNHGLYQEITTLADLHVFLETHVYAVWDFMSLLKALQQHLTCTSTPWFASSNPQTRYLINEIVLAEESDVSLHGTRMSHFEMYLEAMQKCQANTKSVTDFLESVRGTQNVFIAIKNSSLHPNTKSFLEFTFKVIEEGKPHKIAAAFTFGREDLIPKMFHEILENFKEKLPEIDLSELIYYFERHIELDADEHGPMAMEMVTELCGEDFKKWQEVEETSVEALEKRIDLWNGIYETITKKEVYSV